VTSARRTRLDELATGTGEPPTSADIQFLLAEIAHLELCFGAAVAVAVDAEYERAQQRAWVRDRRGTVQ
jgi:hypothetical protein